MRNKKVIIAASVTAVLLVFVSVAFAALASNLNVEFGNVTQNAVTWNVGFKGSEVLAEPDGTGEVGLSCGMANITSSTVTINDSTLSKPGDKCTYPLTITNTGDIAANLSNIAATAPTDVSCDISGSTMVCGNITYKLTTVSGSALRTGVILNSGDMYNIKLVVIYSGEELSSTAVTQSNAKFTLTYSQYSERTTNASTIDGLESPVCKRATTLHTETCEQTDTGCYNAGYYEEGSKNTITITYGSLGTSETLTAGDAFDCDVNGDGNYDPTTERFYYVSGLDGDDTSDYAVLIYFSNVKNGTILTNVSYFDYGNNNGNYNGPTLAYKQLPTTSQWSNVSLSTQTRQIYNELNGTTTYNDTYNLPLFTYNDRAARFLSHKEINRACGITIGNREDGELNSCEYLMENLRYSSSSNASNYLLESPLSSSAIYKLFVTGETRRVSYAYGVFGVRPVIEVPVSDIFY